MLILADTLAAHQIGGFKVGVSFALRKRRDCLASATDMSDKVFNKFKGHNEYYYCFNIMSII